MLERIPDGAAMERDDGWRLYLLLALFDVREAGKGRP